MKFKKVMSLFLAVIMSTAFVSGCGKNAGNESTQTKGEFIAILESPGMAKIQVKSYELVTNSSDQKCIAFTMIYFNQSDKTMSFNDVGNKVNGIFSVYQNGTKLEPRNTDKTANISIEAAPKTGVEVVKAYEYLNTTDSIILELKDAEGNVCASCSVDF